MKFINITPINLQQCNIVLMMATISVNIILGIGNLGYFVKAPSFLVCRAWSNVRSASDQKLTFLHVINAMGSSQNVAFVNDRTTAYDFSRLIW